MQPALTLAVGAVLLVLTGTTCAPPAPKPRVAALRGFSSAEELRQYLVEQAQAATSGGRGGGIGFFPFFAPNPPLLANTAEEALTDASGGASFSTTNLQEAGVDQSDVVKDDGQTIYAVDSYKIHVVRAVPADDLAEIATIELDRPVDALYLRGATLVALASGGGYYGVGRGGAEPGWTSGDGWASDLIGPDVFPNAPEVAVTLIDISDPAQPSVRETITFEGTLASSRLIETHLHLVISASPVLPANPTPQALASMPLEEWIPDYEIRSGDGSVTSSGDVVGWQSFYRPENPDGYGVTTVVTIDIENPAPPFVATAISADAGLVYASTEALYIGDTNYDYELFAFREDTAVHKLAFTSSGTQYVASGLVPGRPLNQYSLGEFDGHLRIATHVSTFSGNVASQSNAVFVLAENPDTATLDIVGRIENIAPGEQIYAARFIGPRGFLVTFRQVDPLFTLDLVDPANPRIVGELKVPGFSNHIQLLDENHLLTIGRDTEENGQVPLVQGLQLTIFDVTDPANPQQLHKTVLGDRWTNSEALYEPKAFNYFADQNVLAFPASGVTDSANWGNDLYVFRVTVQNGFELLGSVPTLTAETETCFYGYYDYLRGVFIAQDVYAVARTGVKSAALPDVGTVLDATPFAAPVSQDCGEVFLPLLVDF